jgi:hypothetical protein
MARKHRKDEQELPFVALMDTLTNVVGVLTIVLVMMGISLARAANRVLSSLPPATAAQVRAAQELVDRLRAEQAKLEKERQQFAKLELQPTKLESLDAELAKLRQNASAKGMQLVDLDALDKVRAKHEAELKQKKEVADRLMAERDRLKGLLDEPSDNKAPPAKIVRIPASRPIPKDAKVEHVLSTKDGVYWVNQQGAKMTFLNNFKLLTVKQMARETVKRGKKFMAIYDYQKLRAFFEKQTLTFSDFQIKVNWVEWSSSPELHLTPKGPASVPFRSSLERIHERPKTVVMFQVTADGFESYLAARRECDVMGVAAGWEFIGGAEYAFLVSEIETNKPKPPPPKPGPPPPPPSGPQIAPPPQKLD